MQDGRRGGVGNGTGRGVGGRSRTAHTGTAPAAVRNGGDTNGHADAGYVSMSSDAASRGIAPWVPAAERMLRGAVEGGASRQVAAAVAAALLRTGLGSSLDTDDAEVDLRAASVRKALRLHQALEVATGEHRHSLGSALELAHRRGVIEGTELAAGRKTQRAANRARHRAYVTVGPAGDGADGGERLSALDSSGADETAVSGAVSAASTGDGETAIVDSPPSRSEVACGPSALLARVHSA